MKKSEIIQMLEVHNIPYGVLSLNDDYTLLVSQRGGRIYGPFREEDGEGLFWMPEFWKSDADFQAFLDSGAWNIGGDRIWIAPELQFSVGDRNRFWETLQTPPSIDPGSYQLHKEGNRITLTQSISLQTHNLGTGQVHLDLWRQLLPAANPIAACPDSQKLMENVSFCGFTHTLRLSAENSPGAAAACWDLLQVTPPGNIYIPMYEPVPGVNYYEPIGNLETPIQGGIVDKATGCNRYKVGYKAANVTGRFGYTGCFGGKPYLLVRCYPNDPSNAYEEEPPAIPGENGFSFHIYNDDGGSGGFTELECNLLSVGGHSGHTTAVDRISTWIYFGEPEQLSQIGKRLLGFEDLQFPQEL